MTKYILAHDLGTTGNKAILCSLEGKLSASVLYEYPVFYPHTGWVEQKPDDFWQAVCKSTKQLLEKANVPGSDVIAVSFSGQMMGCLLVDREGIPLRNTIIWADTRALKQAQEIDEILGMDFIYKTTGHRISSSYSAAKLMWVRDNEKELYKQSYKMLQAKDFIIYKLTGKYVTDYSDASGTGLFNLEKKNWDQSILDALDIPLNLLPDALPSTDSAGTITEQAAKDIGLLSGTPVIIGGGDGSCACVGAGVIAEGNAYNVLGSSSWISLASKTPVYDPDKRTFNWVHLDPNLYTPCGTMQAAGYSYNWYRNTMCLDEIETGKKTGEDPYKIIDSAALASPPGANGLLFLPYLLGERSPRWDQNARGAFIGLDIRTGKGDISRSILEGVGFNLKIILEILEQGTAAAKIDEIIMIGGGAKGEVWLQILSDIWQKPLVIPRYTEEATSLGAAVCGGIGAGVFKDFSVIRLFNSPVKQIIPNRNHASKYAKLFPLFNRAYEALVDVNRGLVELED